MIDFLSKILFPLERKPKKKLTDLEKYIVSHNPDSLEQVEWLQKKYMNSRSRYDSLYR